MNIVLIGFMGAGKTTVGHILAEKLGLPFVDADILIEQRQKRSIRDIFDQDGEPVFRRIEHDTIVETVRGPDAVIALGGGAVEHPETRRLLRYELVVYLEVSYEEAMLRIGGDTYRPMLDVNDIPALHARRLPIYEQVATIRMPTGGRRPEAIVMDLISQVTAPPELPEGVRSVLVAPMGGAYQVHIAPGLVGQLDVLLPSMTHAQQAFIVMERGRRTIEVDLICEAFERRGLRSTVITVPPGEDAKNLRTVEEVGLQLAAYAAHPDDVVVGLGGESLCDVAGFVAATYNRGMPLIYIPTSLLAQVDSAIGGKNAVNLPHGRNLMGTIHQPEMVVCDPDIAFGADRDGFRSGLAEMVKHALIDDADLLEDLRSSAADILAGERDVLVDMMARSVQIKADIVTADEREQGQRVHLNYGHTFGHALEHLYGTDGMSHGDAISLGMMAAAYLAAELGMIGEGVIDAHRSALRAFGLPVSREVDIAELEQVWLRDKKYKSGVRFVLLEGIGQPEGAVSADRQVLLRAVARLAG